MHYLGLMRASEAGVSFADKRGAVRDRPTAERMSEDGTIRDVWPRIRVHPAHAQRGRKRQGALSEPLLRVFSWRRFHS